MNSNAVFFPLRQLSISVGSLFLHIYDFFKKMIPPKMYQLEML